jgi:hypothetical protein
VNSVPEYQEKLIASLLLAPASFMKHSADWLVAGSQTVDEIEDYYEENGRLTAAKYRYI